MSFVAQIQANIDDFSSNLDKAQAKMDEFSQSISQKISKLGSTFQKLGGVVSVGITAPLTAAGVAAFNMATDFEDALGATDEVFQESSASIKDWANNLETYYGVAKKEALEYSNMMGTMLTNIGGLSRKEAAETSQNLVQLAGDLTAMYGGQVSESVNALTGALRGNNVMLTRYGIAINEAMIQAKALEMGLVSTGKEMDLTSKQAATLALIYEQSSAAQGQAAREADGASGSMRAFRTEITNLSTEIGMVLLPVVTPLINRLKEIVQGFRGLSPETQKVIVAVSGVAAALGPLLLGLGTLMKMAPLIGTAFTAATGPIGIAIAAIVAAAVLIIKNWDKIKEYFTTGNGAKFWDSISSNAQRLWKSLTTIFNAISAFVTMVWEKIGSNVISYVSNAFNIVLSVVDAVISNVTDIINFFSALIRGDFKGAIESIGNMFTNSFNLAKSIVTNVIAGISQQLSGFLKLVGANELGSKLENWANGLIPVKTETQAVSEKVEESTEKITTQTTALNANADATTKAGKGIKNYRGELDQLLASWGIYEAQMSVINTSFREVDKLAKNAGASLSELQTIASREWVEKAGLQLEKLSKSLKTIGVSGLSNSSLTIPVQATVDADFSKLDERLQNLKADLRGFIELDLANMLGSSVANMASAIGDALGQGGNIIDAIGQGILRSLGSLAKSIGEQMIAFGVAGIALKKLMMNPYLAIAAGAALVALGSFAQSSIGKQTSSYNGGYSSSSAANMNNSDYSQWRGAYYNNDRQKVEFEIAGNKLKGVLNVNDTRDKRLG